MNYTTFFVVLSAVGVLVFVGIFGAAWMSAAERDRPERGETMQVVRPLPEVSLQTSDIPLTTELAETSTAATVALATSKQLSSNYNPGTTHRSIASPPAVAARELFLDSEKTTSTNNPTESESDESQWGCPVKILTDETGTIQPTYRNEDHCEQWLVQYLEGYGVDIYIDRLELDGSTNDFLLISADQYTIEDGGNPVLTWKLTQKRTYRILDKGTAFLAFVTHESKDIDSDIKEGGFRLRYTRYGNITSEETTTDIPVPTPPSNNEESITVIIIYDDVFDETEFKSALAERANEFCEEKNIKLKDGREVTKQNVYISSTGKCQQTWPKSDRCLQLTFAIAVDNIKSKKYELTRVHLQDMWNSWKIPSVYGFEKMQQPNYKKHVKIYAIVCSAFIIVFSIGLVVLWQWQLRNSTTKEEDKPRASVPIETPPLFDYFDTRLDDPEYLSYYDSMYSFGTETSTDDVKFSYGVLPSLRQSQTGASTFHFTKPANVGIENNAFTLEEDDEEEEEIMNRNTIMRKESPTESETNTVSEL